MRAPLITQRLALDDVVRAYDTLANAATERALEVPGDQPAHVTPTDRSPPSC